MKKFIFTFLAFVFIFSAGISSSFAQSLDIKASEKITAEVNGLNTPDAKTGIIIPDAYYLDLNKNQLKIRRESKLISCQERRNSTLQLEIRKKN